MLKTEVVISAVIAFLAVLAVGSAAMAQGVVGAPTDWQIGTQVAATPVKESIEDFHNLLLVIITVITLFVTGLLVYVMVRFNSKANPTPSKVSHNTLIEVVWTVVPVIILIVIAVPSFKLLYFQERIENAEMTIKAIGRQWYWDYEYTDHDLAFSSYMIPDEEIQPGQRRLLEVDNRVVLPVGTNVRIQITAGDVLHSWAVPALGIKMDAVPGRLNQTWVRINEEGVYYGQCSELCGVNHGFMPIAVEAVSKEAFARWVAEKKVALGIPAEPAAEVALAPAASR